MRILILGGDGMLGHQLLKSLQGSHEVHVTLRRPLDAYAAYGLFHAGNSHAGLDVRDFNRLAAAIKVARPQAVINAVGIVKQRSESYDVIPSLEVNALLPHRLSELCGEMGARLIQVSTDCVFSGNKGMYTEHDAEDATDLYGRSKLLGEVHDPHAVTLRTSIIGLELAHNKSLIEWFLAQQGGIKGFRRAIYSGFTTAEMARIIELVLIREPEISGLWHVASAPISKFELLMKLQSKLGLNGISIEPDDTFVCDRSLDGSKFNGETDYHPPAWDTMLDELAEQVRKRGR